MRMDSVTVRDDLRVLVNGDYLCTALNLEKSQKLFRWLVDKEITGKKVFLAQSMADKLACYSMIRGDKCPFDYAPWCNR